MGCGVCKLSLSKQQTGMTLVGTGVLRYDAIFREMERPLLKIQKAEHKLRSSLCAFHAAVGMSSSAAVVTFFDAVMGMLLCYSASAGGTLQTVGFAALPQPPYVLIDVNRLAQEHKKIPECWTRLISVALKTQTKLESLTPIITGAANDIASVADEASILPESSTHVKLRLMRNQKVVTEAPSVMAEILDQVYEMLHVATTIPDMIEGASQVIMFIGRKAQDEGLMCPRDLVDSYWVLNSYAVRYNKE